MPINNHTYINGYLEFNMYLSLLMSDHFWDIMYCRARNLYETHELLFYFCIMKSKLTMKVQFLGLGISCMLAACLRVLI